MESIIQYFKGFDLDIVAFLRANCMLIGAFLALAILGRFVFGKKSVLCRSVSSAIGIFFVYCLTVLLCYAGAAFQRFIAPLPLVTIKNETMTLFSFQQDYTIVCAEVLSMIILAFLANLIDTILPMGKLVLM